MTSLVNKYYKKGSKIEQKLISGLVTESIKITGDTYYYLPRNVQQVDLILGEDVISKFTLAIPIEMKLIDVSGFEGQREWFSKFGYEMQNSYKLAISKERWEKEVKKKFDGESYNGEADFSLLTNLRPQEGDLVYDPVTKFLMEIKFVDHDSAFFQLNSNYQYVLSCEAFKYANETIETGVEMIDLFDTNNSINIVDNKLLTEDGDALVLDFDGCSYLLYDAIEGKKDMPYGTDFSQTAEDIRMNTTNPFDTI